MSFTSHIVLICALQFADFLRLCLSPRTTSRTISFSISNRLFSRNALPVVTRDAIDLQLDGHPRSILTADRSISYWKDSRKVASSFFFSFKLPLLSLRGSSGQRLALWVQKWRCRCYMRLSSALFRPCFSKKLPTTCSEQCCSLVVVQRIFQHIKKTFASLGSVVSLSSFSFSFLFVEQVRLFLLPFSFRPQGDWHVNDWGCPAVFFFIVFRSFLFF